ncbi:MAG: hypothetical protein HW413_2610, partial [Thermoleophilia bacterium]|nr:hypothetical protein [Thermoleophilia bacterium]
GASSHTQASVGSATRSAATTAITKMRAFTPSNSLVLGEIDAACSNLDEQRVALAAAGADRCEAEPAPFAPELVHHRRHDTAP